MKETILMQDNKYEGRLSQIRMKNSSINADREKR